MINYQSGQSNQISYTFAGGNGFSAMIGAEQGRTVTGLGGNMSSTTTCHTFLLVRSSSRVGAQSPVLLVMTAYVEEFAGKLRLDVKFNDMFSAFFMGGYQS